MRLIFTIKEIYIIRSDYPSPFRYMPFVDGPGYGFRDRFTPWCSRERKKGVAQVVGYTVSRLQPTLCVVGVSLALESKQARNILSVSLTLLVVGGITP